MTLKKEPEEEMTYFTELLKYVIEHTRSSVAVHDTEMNYVYVSNRYYDDMRLSDTNIIGRNHYEVFPHLPEYIREAHRRALRGEVVSAESDTLKWPDGRVDWANWQCRPWYGADGSIKGIIIYIEVLTGQKLAEEKLKNQQLLISEMGRVAKIGGWEFDAETGEAAWTDQTAIIHDMEPGSKITVVEGITFYKPESRKRLETAINEAIELAKPYDLELELITARGNEKWVQTIGNPIRENGRVIKVRGSFQEITERKRIQQDLISAKEMAEESDRLKTAFLNNISHEIRTPMNAIVGFSAMLSDPGLDDVSKKSFTDTIIQSSDQLLAIINDIVDISNIEAGIVKLADNTIRINDVFRRMEEMFRLKANETGIEFSSTTPLPDNEAVVIADSTKFAQILTNLLSNAFKFTATGKINLGYRKRGQFYEFRVSDTGIGISQDKLLKIFDRFYQVGNELSRAHEGTGLGLSICKAYVELMGGKIWAVSEPEKGSAFYFTLPDNKPEPSKESKASKPAKIHFGKVLHILVAEDDEVSAMLLLKYLALPEFRVTIVGTGSEAVEVINSDEPVDLVLMDLKMPGMDGFEATRLIRKNKPHIPIIAQTAYALSDDRERALAIGCNDLITKPFRKDYLLRKILEHLQD